MSTDLASARQADRQGPSAAADNIDGDRRVVVRPSAGLNPRVAADLLVDAARSLGDADISVVISSVDLTVVGATAADLITPIRHQADRHGRERDRLALLLADDALDTVAADRRLAQWSEAGLRHEQSLLLLSYLRGSGQ